MLISWPLGSFLWKDILQVLVYPLLNQHCRGNIPVELFRFRLRFLINPWSGAVPSICWVSKCWAVTSLCFSSVSVFSFKGCCKTALHRPSEALTIFQEEKDSWKTILCQHYTWQRPGGEIVNSTFYLTRQMLWGGPIHLKRWIGSFCVQRHLLASAVCQTVRETITNRKRQPYRDRDLGTENTTVSPSATTYWQGSQTLPTGNTHLLPGNTSDISNIHHQPSPPPANGTWVLK